MDKINVNTEKIEQNREMFEKYNVPEKLIDRMEKTIEEQKAKNNDSFSISVYAPSILENTEYDVQPFATTTTTSYFTYKNHEFKNYQVKYTGLSADEYKNQGTSTKAKAQGFINLIITIGGTVNKTLSAFGTGISALSAFESMHGNVTHTTSDDKMFVNISYDKIEKMTSMKYGTTYRDGDCLTFKVWLNTNDTYQYYASLKKGYLNSKFLNQVYYSENFQNPAEKILQTFPTPHVDFTVRIKIIDMYVAL